MDATKEKEIKKLRQRIHGIRSARLGWDVDTFRQVMAGLGYGTDLKALDYDELKELHGILKDYKRPEAARYDKQGNYMYALMKEAGWTDLQMRSYMVLHFRKSHWMVLDKDERKNVINMLKACLEVK